MPLMLRSILSASVVVVLATPLAGQSTPPPGGPDTLTFESDEAALFLEVFRTVSRFHSSALGDSVLWERAIEGLLEQLDDPYATVFTPAEYDSFRETNTGDYAGIGVQISALGGRVTVTAVFRDTPAEGAGMMVGDRIVWVEGHDARDWTLDQARDSIRGKPGSVVQIRVARDGYRDAIPLSMVRDNVHVAAVQATLLEGGVAHIAIERIARGVADELEEALRDFEGASALIMDLRRNPGGYLDESLRVADLFLAPGQGLAGAEARDFEGEVQKQEWPAQSPARLPNTPIVILVDEYTASAAEIISGALQDHDRAVVIGQRTFGKGVIQTVYPLPAGRRISITTGSWHTPLGRSLHRLRHRDGTLKPDDGAGQTVATLSGRELRSGGGIFPDLEVADEEYKPEEVALLNHANQVPVPLAVLIREYALELAKDAIEADRFETLPSSAFDGLAQSLVDAGMDAEIVNDPVARAYLDWRTQARYLYRANATSLMLTVLAERDRVLAEGLRLARAARTPEELFTLVDQTEGR
jgi:carboxyl-terminal processing protease